MCGEGAELLGVAERVTGKGQPGQPRHVQQPVGQRFQAVGGDAQEFQAGASLQLFGQRAQPITGEHQLLEPAAGTKLGGNCGQQIVCQDQPAQRRRQCSAGQVGDAVCLEADHLQLRTVAQGFRYLIEGVIGAEQDAQTMQP